MVKHSTVMVFTGDPMVFYELALTYCLGDILFQAGLSFTQEFLVSSKHYFPLKKKKIVLLKLFLSPYVRKKTSIWKVNTLNQPNICICDTKLSRSERVCKERKGKSARG